MILPRIYPRLLVLALAAPLLAGCAQSQYVPEYAFYPQPAAVEVANPTGPQNRQVPLTVLANVLGIRNADPNSHIPYSVAIRLRFENNGPSRVVFDPRTLELTNGELRAFPPPQTDPGRVLVSAPGERKELTAYFPFPPGTTARDWDLKRLRLRWRVNINDYPVLQTAYFERGQPREEAADY